ncbi:MAG TPA: TonB family protein, partial [Terriglobales bacterium]|nr:TonB family protein [Terriglobales bacterium]
EPTPEPEAAEAAVLESLPELPGSRAGQSAAAVVAAQAEPIAASSTGTAAAAAPAPEKPAAIDLKPSVMPPMVTNEPIVAENSPAVDPFADAPLEAPSFSSLDSMTLGERRGGGKVLKVAAVLVIIAALGYVGWQKLHPLQYLHLASTAVEPARDDTIPAPVAEPASIPPSPSAETQTPTTPADTSSTLVPGVTDTAPAAEPPAAAVPRRDLAPETIEVQELPISRDAKPAPAAPKPQPLVVKSGAGAKAESVQPPPLQVATTDVSNSALAGIMPTNAVVPKVAPGSLRVSQGVSQGLLLKKVPPRYPPAALQMRKEGTVELQAAVGKDGSITSVQVLSGDPMLARSAVDAVRQWKYRPYLLNGEPVEIQTQITINFKVPH